MMQQSRGEEVGGTAKAFQTYSHGMDKQQDIFLYGDTPVGHTGNQDTELIQINGE